MISEGVVSLSVYLLLMVGGTAAHCLMMMSKRYIKVYKNAKAATNAIYFDTRELFVQFLSLSLMSLMTANAMGIDLLKLTIIQFLVVRGPIVIVVCMISRIRSCGFPLFSAKLVLYFM